MVVPSAVSFDSIQIRDQYLRDNRTLLTGLIGRRRGGSDIWKRRVLALVERSVLSWLGAIYGYNTVVADHFEHGVQQDGDAMPVGFER